MADTEPVRVSWRLSIGLSNAYQDGEFEIDRTDWDERSPSEREKLLDEMYQEENADLDDPVSP